jgi:uncharacterized repeat protein (TIGR01451 family)
MRRRPFGQKTSVVGGRRRPGARPRLEALEGRQLLAIFHVTSLGDEATGTGTSGTLRYVIGEANKTSETDTIDFQLDASLKVDGVWTIKPTTPLPDITAPVFLNGQVGSATTPQVVLDGSSITAAGANGLKFGSDGDSSSTNSTLVSLAINHFSGAGIAVDGVSNVTIRGNYIGTDAAGESAAPNGVGVLLTNVQTSTIGGQSTGTRNVISGNTGAGVRIVGSGSQNNNLQGNYIGLDKDGVQAIPNNVGIEIAGTGGGAGGAHDNVIGGLSSSSNQPRNVISGNTAAGIRILDSGSNNNQIQNNYIGTDKDGGQAIPNGVGVFVGSGASGNSVGGLTTSVRNVISGNTGAGVEVAGARNTLIGANYVGTKSDGFSAVGGGGQSTAGILIRDGAENTSVGGTSTGAGNLISGNVGPGVWVRGRTGGDSSIVATSGTVIQGNTIGLNDSGTTAIANGQGVAVTDGATSTSIGGVSTAMRNVISGNTGDGVLLASFDTSGSLVQGNFIGPARDGTTARGNGGAGVRIDGATGSQVGGSLSGAANTIANNDGAGVWVQSGSGNSIRRNVINDNGGLGIDLGPQGVTPNDSGDGDSGANDLQNFPVIDSVTTTGGVTRISGKLNSQPNRTYILEFYSDPDPDPSGHGEGPTFLGTTTVSTGTDGNATFTTTATSVVPVGVAVTATATVQESSTQSGSTSEFAQNVSNTIPQADLVLTQSASTPSTTLPNTVAAGGYLTYTLTLTNSGPATAPGVSVLDTLPTGASFVGATSGRGSVSLGTGGDSVTFNLGDLASGQTVTMTITTVAPGTVPDSGTISNRAVASLGTTAVDPDADNNTSVLSTTILAGVDLALNQLAAPNPVSVGTEVAFVLTITNISSTTANGAVLVDTLPANFVYTRSETSQGTIDVANGILTVNLGSLPPAGITGAGSSARVVVWGIPTAVGALTNTAIVMANEPQVVPNSNASSQVVGVLPPLATTPAATPPHVLSLARRGGSRLALGFDQALNASTAQDLNNYRLVAAGRDRRFGTPDDVVIRLASAAYDASSKTVTLAPGRPINPRMPLLLGVNGLTPTGVSSTTGVLLDGNNDGIPGGNYLATVGGATAPVPRGPLATATARNRRSPRG